MRWIEALKIWNARKGGAWCVPRKGTDENAEVRRIMNAGKEERMKKEVAEEMKAVPPKKLKPRVREEVKEAIVEKKKEGKREKVKVFLKRAIEKRRGVKAEEVKKESKKEKVKSFLKKALEKRRAKKLTEAAAKPKSPKKMDEPLSNLKLYLTVAEDDLIDAKFEKDEKEVARLEKEIKELKEAIAAKAGEVKKVKPRIKEVKTEVKVEEKKESSTAKRDSLELRKAVLTRKIAESKDDDEKKDLRKELKKVRDELALLPPEEIRNSPSAPPKDVNLKQLFIKFTDNQKGMFEEKVIYERKGDSLKTLYKIVGAQARYPYQTAEKGKVLSNYQELITPSGKPMYRLKGVKKEREGDKLNLYEPSEAEKEWLKSGTYPKNPMETSLYGQIVV